MRTDATATLSRRPVSRGSLSGRRVSGKLLVVVEQLELLVFQFAFVKQQFIEFGKFQQLFEQFRVVVFGVEQFLVVE